MTEENREREVSFIHKIVDKDVATGKCQNVRTRFPPEPNGRLHVGHAKAICLNFAIARDFNGECNLRFDDTNPERERPEYEAFIINDIEWLGYRCERTLRASDYFEKFYQFAVELLKKGKAFVCSLSKEHMRAARGTLTEPGVDSPFRNRGLTDNLDLFKRMKEGEFEVGEHVLRAKIDMSSGNINMRDPVIYRILNVAHHRTGERWHIYPTYDFAHCLSDSIEGISHSLCSLEFEDHRRLYDWFLSNLGVHRPQQIEFARLKIKYTLTSKRATSALIATGKVDGWDDPRLCTIAGMRRRGFPPPAIRDFCLRVGLTKKDSWTEMDLLESCVRKYLNAHAFRYFALLRPMKVIIDNYPEGQVEEIRIPNRPGQGDGDFRTLLFSRVIYIDRDDYSENPPENYYRLAPGREVRLKHAYYLRCQGARTDANGELVAHCLYDPETLGGKSADGRKVRGAIQWLSDNDSIFFTAKLYERLFSHPFASALPEPAAALNNNSLTTLRGCRCEPLLSRAKIGQAAQFERIGYFCLDTKSSPGNLVFNRTLPLRDGWKRKSEGKAG